MGMSNVMFVGVTVTEIMAAKVRTYCQMPLNVATLNKHCSAIFHSRNFVLHHITHQNVLYGHVKCDARRSNSFWENGCQSQNILQNAHFFNGSQSNIIDRRDLAEEHIWDSCMYKRPWNLRTSGSNRYENNARRSRGGGTLHPEKHENGHISVENRHTVMIQVSADSKFHALQLCYYNASSKIDISTPKQQFRENAWIFVHS